MIFRPIHVFDVAIHNRLIFSFSFLLLCCLDLLNIREFSLVQLALVLQFYQLLLFYHVFFVLLVALILVLENRTLINFNSHFVTFWVRPHDLYFGLEVCPIILWASAASWTPSLVQVRGEGIREAGVHCSGVDLRLVH